MSLQKLSINLLNRNIIIFMDEFEYFGNSCINTYITLDDETGHITVTDNALYRKRNIHTHNILYYNI